MNDLREIVDLQSVERLFNVLAIALPLAGAAIGAWRGAKSGRLKHGLIVGLIVGMLGPLNLLLWRIYNLITQRNGLDTVRNLQINLIVFVSVGAVIGFIIGLLRSRPTSAEASSDIKAESISDRLSTE